jgi:hypothetical protein
MVQHLLAFHNQKGTNEMLDDMKGIIADVATRFEKPLRATMKKRERG